MLYLSMITFGNTLGMLDIWLVLKLFFGCDVKLTRWTMVISAGIFSVLNVIFYLLWEEEGYFITLLIYSYVVIVTIILTKQKRFRAVWMTIPAVLIYSQVCEIFYYLQTLMGLDEYYISYEQIGGEAIDITIADVFADVLLFFILIQLWKYTTKKAMPLTLKLGEGIMITFFCFTIPGISDTLKGAGEGRVYHSICSAFFLVLNGVVIYAIAHRKKAAYYRGLSENYKKQFTQEYSYFQDYKQNQADTIKFRHDWKNHMLLLQQMLEQKEYEKAKVYFSDLSEKTVQYKQKILTGNEIVDMIVTSKMDVLEQEQIELSCNEKLDTLGFMEDVDCCILFSNLIDNAIEANEKVETKRYITITAHETPQMRYVEISNPIKKTVEVGAHGIETTKDQPKEHGIGLKNVYEIIEKYHGEYHITVEGKEFSVQLLFPIQMLKERIK